MFVDTAPVMEKPLAEAAGLGWQGKHTNLVSRDARQLAVPRRDLHRRWSSRPTRRTPMHCGSCRACQDACPTDAFPAPYRLDARRCISYLTIEHKGPIPDEFRAAIGNRIYGCDDCLAVCPWNQFADAARGQPRVPAARRAGRAARWPTCSRSTMPASAQLFAGSPIKRIGRDRMVRNAAIAAGNSGRAELAPVLERLAGCRSGRRGGGVMGA